MLVLGLLVALIVPDIFTLMLLCCFRVAVSVNQNKCTSNKDAAESFCLEVEF